MRMRFTMAALACALGAGAARADVLPTEATQLVVSIAPSWQDTRGTLMLLDRTADGWRAASPVIPVLYGKHGLAWGRGVPGTEEKGVQKHEGDGRAPAGLFAIGTIYGDDPALPEGADYPYHQVTARDAWIDDPKHPLYNQHVAIDDPTHPPAWFEKHRMRVGDAAFRWRVEIRHNAAPALAGAGSVIFFHIRRGPERRTAGCTVMAEEDLLAMIRWLRADRKPHYVLLPYPEYLARIGPWGLPPVEAIRELAPQR
jgi:L,D-peptidoglycan transpeptidase YkuD (ErfK/YbiS/YcfS/YnhG family)